MRVQPRGLHEDSAGGRSQLRDSVAGGTSTVSPGGSRSCAEERGSRQASSDGALQGPGGTQLLPGDVFGHLRPGHPDLLRAEQLFLYLGDGSDQPGSEGPHSALHLHGVCRRGKRHSHRDSGSGEAEDRAQRHRLPPNDGHSHSRFRQPHRDVAGGGFELRRWRHGADHHAGGRRPGRTGLSGNRRRRGIRQSSLSVRPAPDPAGPLQRGLSEHGDFRKMGTSP